MTKSESSGIQPTTTDNYIRPAIEVIDIQPEGSICNTSSWDGSAEFDDDNPDYPI